MTRSASRSASQSPTTRQAAGRQQTPAPPAASAGSSPPASAATSGTAGTGGAQTVTTDGCAGLGAVLQQLLAAVTRLDTRVGTIEASNKGSPSPTTTAVATSGDQQPVGRQLEDGQVPVQVQVCSGGADDVGGDDGDGSGSSDDDDDQRRRGPAQSVRHGKRRSIKDLELPTYTPSPKVLVSTWIERVDLALEGARSSRRDKWSDHELYYILGNKLLESASRWWVLMNRKLTDGERTWTTLKKALQQRYGERLDMSAAE
ncbi:hypothetical protein PR003_g7366 [Phytophthora rubi]|uniref:Retrotransposon gag domain-containing protein n=1 Tax=Phytophthora rubi TaxID=129364 RepID=A0A6A4FE25_9STRA|nr:hypothetical protein PR002_g7934 [Phytophthora rubi]KAE9346543.1 hypothetical protein PR003_g7366 [Phytophthora rubi]